MIAYFPSFYPDELLYSLFARYYIKSGYMAYIYAAEDLYFSKTTRPDIEFINELKKQTKEILTKNIAFEDVIFKHTMFAYYGRFLPAERKIKAFEALANTDKGYNNYLYIPKSKTGKRYLRYCPLCASDDKNKYGETYWHRKHQIPAINICPIHFCKLINTTVEISSKISPSLISADEFVKDFDIEYSENVIECKVAKYIYDIFNSDLDLKIDINTGDFLHSKMGNSKYVSLRGEQRNMTILLHDFQEYYKNIPDVTLREQWQMQKIFNNKRFNPYEICLLAMFLNVTVNELVYMKLPERKQQEIFDEKVISLHNQGLKYPEIARRLNASYDVVKAIGEGKYGYYHYCVKNPQKGGAKKKDWTTFDINTLPLVVDIIDKLNSESKPQKITIGTIERIIGIPKRSLRNCPLCLAEIKKYIISQEEFYAKKVVWAIKKIIADNRVVNYTNIAKITHIKKHHFMACIPYIEKYGEKNIVTQLETIL